MVLYGNFYCNNVCPVWGIGINEAWTLLGLCNLPFFDLPYLTPKVGVGRTQKKGLRCMAWTWGYSKVIRQILADIKLIWKYLQIKKYPIRILDEGNETRTKWETKK